MIDDICNQSQLGITYAIWAGVGSVLVALVGAILYKQIPDIPAVIGMGLIIAGVVIINVCYQLKKGEISYQL